MGDGPCIRPLNILRSTAIGCEAKYELTKNGLKEEFSCSEIEALVKKRSCKGHICYISDFRQKRQTKDSGNLS